MSSNGAKVLLHVLNVVITILTAALACVSIWFFVQVTEFTSLRNSNHYLLDYNVYWPQAIPWMFLIVSVLCLSVACCGFAGANKRNRGLLFLYIVCLSVAVVLLIAVAVIALVFADSKSTDNFVKDTVWDVYFQSKIDDQVAASFGNIERKLHCCGADGPRDYINWKKNEFPQSCCDTYYHGWLAPYSIDCDFTNKLANERHGCSEVALQYSRIAIKAMAVASIFIAFLAIISVITAVSISRSIQRSNRILAAKMESESEKVLI